MTTTRWPHASRWGPWLVGAALVAGVAWVALRLADARDFVELAEKANPAWLVWAVLLQAGTYLAQGEVFRCVARAGKQALPVRTIYPLSLAKLFVDQALPSAGLSGTVVLAHSLEARGLPRALVAAGVVVDLASYYLVYLCCLGAALAFSLVHGEAGRLVLMASLLFGLFALGIVVIAFTLAGQQRPGLARRLARLRPLRAALGFLEQADRGIARNPKVLAQAALCQWSLLLLDAATVWVLLRSVGVTASPAGVFASFTLSTLFRILGFLPGGLGSFEAASVLTLNLVGVPMPAALSATLLFRGLSFWLPMLPGFWLSRQAARTPAEASHATPAEAHWVPAAPDLLARLHSRGSGLHAREAARRLVAARAHALQAHHRPHALLLLLAQFRSPILLMLLAAAGLSFFLHDPFDALLILLIVTLSGLLGFWQEKSAGDAVARLLAVVRVNATVLRDGRPVEIPVEQVVPGDLVLLHAGDVVPGDGRVLESRDLFVDEAGLTGETFPAEKAAGTLPADTPLARRSNTLYLGTHVVSGTATQLIVQTGRQTEFGRLSATLRTRSPETDFEHGIRRFGFFLLEVTLLLVLGIFACNAYLGRPVLDSLLFALALAVGLTPQLLPAIISVNLAHGARRMAARRVIIKHLPAIENFGSMTLLCSDKTGTLTEGTVRLEQALDLGGAESPRVLEAAALNAAFQAGYTNPLDPAILARHPVERTRWRKLDEEPYDFTRRRLSVLLDDGRTPLLLTKGSVPSVLEACTRAETAAGSGVDLAEVRPAIERLFQDLSRRGHRVIAVACRPRPGATRMTREDETGMTFLGLLSFSDPLRPGIVQTLEALRQAGIRLKLVTGDHHLVALEVSRQAGLDRPRLLTGGELRGLSDPALQRRVRDIDVFAEVEPNQKERLIRALRHSGEVVGYMGDGINDAAALHAADVGISVAGAVDVAREAADVVLLEKNLDVLLEGVREGRTTFANTLKYVFMATSANFGNMFSMAGASLLLPFLPLLPKQILLLNLLTDLPEMAIAGDQVDEEWIRRPRRWDVRFIRRFMIVFGLLSSTFDYATFAVLWHVLGLNPDQFRAGWFVESILSAALVVLVVRTPRPCLRSRPSRPLWLATLLVAGVTLALPYSGPAATLLGLAPPGLHALGLVLGITLSYALAAEFLKRRFWRHPAGPGSGPAGRPGWEESRATAAGGRPATAPAPQKSRHSRTVLARSGGG